MPEATQQTAQTKQYVRIEQIAQLLGVSVRRVQQLTQEGIIKSEKVKGKLGREYDFVPTIHSLLTYYREKADKHTGPSDALEEERLRRERARATLDELKVKRAEGELFDAKTIEKMIGAVFTRIRTGLFSLPMGVAPLLRDQGDINAIAEIIQSRLHELLSEIINFDMAVFKAYCGAEYIAEAEDEEEEEADAHPETGKRKKSSVAV